MGKDNLYTVCKPCQYICTGHPCEAFLQLSVLHGATELCEEEIRHNLAIQLEEVGSGK